MRKAVLRLIRRESSATEPIQPFRRPDRNVDRVVLENRRDDVARQPLSRGVRGKSAVSQTSYACAGAANPKVAFPIFADRQYIVTRKAVFPSKRAELPMSQSVEASAAGTDPKSA